MNICAITLCSYRDKLFFHQLNKLDPKPNIWLIFNEKNPVTEKSEYRFQHVADNYNSIKRLIPDTCDYTLIFEDDALVIPNSINIHKETFKNYPADISSFPFYARTLHKDIKEKIKNLDLMTPSLLLISNLIKRVPVKNRKGIQQIDGTSFNNVLLKTECIKRVTFKGKNKSGTLYIDNIFFLDLKKLGYKLYCNFDIIGLHLNTFIWPGNLFNQPHSEIEINTLKELNLVPTNFVQNKGMFLYTLLDVTEKWF